MVDLPKEKSQKKLSIPIGVDDYKVMLQGNYLYIDKTLLIKEFWETAPVVLITRPRRFGKTIALSMLRYFFEKTEVSNAPLFENSKIWQEKEFQKLQGTYPVIHISFKDIKYSSWEKAYEELKNLLAKEVYRTLSSIEPLMDDYYRGKYEVLVKKTANEAEFSDSLLFISEAFGKYLKKKSIILVDEYDTPITHAYVHKYYNPMIEFMRNLLSKALKGNVHLDRSMMTGVVRTAKDGIVSGLNNPKICTMLDCNFSDKFGFTQQEVDQALLLTDRLDRKEEVKFWYNGYIVGAEYLSDPSTRHLSTSIYNPWSILSYLDGSLIPKTYWANTGSTDILEKVIEESSEETQEELKALMERKSLENKEIDQDVILLKIDEKGQEPWSFLFFAGYITAIGHVFRDNKDYYKLALPNQEIAELYKKLVMNAIGKKFSSLKLEKLLKALIQGDVFLARHLLGEFVGSFCSSHDLPMPDLERSLHLFVLGLLVSLSEKYVIESNLESGSGRYDIMLCPRLPNAQKNPGMLLEFKKGKLDELESLAQEALDQIRDKNYTSQIRKLGHLGEIFCYGIASHKKEIFVKKENISKIE